MRRYEIDLQILLARRTAAVMFSLALIFLMCQAVLVVLWADVPMLVENAMHHAKPGSIRRELIKMSLTSSTQASIQWVTLVIMFTIWPVVIFEAAYHWLTRRWYDSAKRLHWFSLLVCVCPSLRMCARSPEMGGRIWLPGLGWRIANRRLRERLERHFGVPMIVIALMIMPVLIVEWFMKAQVAEHTWLRVLLHISTGAIWFAFAGEFILMFSVAEKKIKYCKEHWIDLAIILLPLISFLRSLRVLRMFGAANFLRISQLTQFARVYRLRGTSVRALRALMLLDLFQRIAGGPEKSIKRMRKRLHTLETEADDLRKKIRKMERQQRETRSRDSAMTSNPPRECSEESAHP